MYVCANASIIDGKTKELVQNFRRINLLRHDVRKEGYEEPLRSLELSEPQFL